MGRLGVLGYSSLSYAMICTLKLLITKKEIPKQEEDESQMSKALTPSLLGCCGFSEWQEHLKRHRGLIYIYIG
jgi:hypothetical protein